MRIFGSIVTDGKFMVALFVMSGWLLSMFMSNGSLVSMLASVGIPLAVGELMNRVLLTVPLPSQPPVSCADLMNLIPEAIEFRKSAEVPILKREKNKVVMPKITINSIDNKTIYGEGCLCR